MSALIAIEGIDGSGKGTQAARLQAHYVSQGLRAALLSFPQYQQTRFGAKIGDFLNGRFGSLDVVHPLLVSLLFAGDRFESKDLIERSLATNDVVICDRYMASNIAHQGAKVSDSERADLIDWIQHLESSIYKLPQAQLTLFLDVPVPQAQRLIAAKSQRTYTDKAADLQEADAQYLQNVRNVYTQLATSPDWITIPCVANQDVRSMDAITADIVAAVSASGILQT
ncbi:dTMP kinase [Schlesneria paludicola]|uniref:dTMP kinase n=1 Tax=Schlesneria paludicola TaxID=360056 RepID=UPI00029A8F08|nr:dTMP kinase [Schlesneria paludicola]